MPPRERQKLQPRPGDYIRKGPWRPPEEPIDPNDYIRKGPYQPNPGSEITKPFPLEGLALFISILYISSYVLYR